MDLHLVPKEMDLHLDLHGRYLLSKACETAIRSDGKVTYVFPTPPRPQKEWYPEEEIHQDLGNRFPPKKQRNQVPPPRLRQHGAYAENGAFGAHSYNSVDNMTYGMPGPAMSNVPGTTNGYGMTYGTTAPSSVYGAMPAQMPNNHMFNAPNTGNVMFGSTGAPGGLDPRLAGHTFMY